MNLETARIMKDAGHPEVKEAVICPVLDVQGGYQLCFGPGACVVFHTLESRRGRRIFKTIDAANKQAVQLGYRFVSIVNPEVKSC